MARATRSATGASETALAHDTRPTTTKKVPSKKAATAAAPPPRSRSTKRPASPEPSSRDSSPAPPTKRRKAGTRIENGVEPVKKPKVAPAKPATKKAEKVAAPKKKEPTVKKAPRVTQKKPLLNPVPAPPEHLRPAPVLFVWGAGNFGQFGMGEDSLDELKKPTRNKLFEQKMEDGAFGEPGAGLESIAAGGMSSLFIDEQGVVWSCGANDDAALGRVTADVPDPEKEGQFLDVDALTAQAWPLQSLKDEKFRAVQVAAGDNISAVISDAGELRVWGSFRAAEGHLGFSDGRKHQFLPIPILDVKSRATENEKFASVVAGNNHLVVLTTHGDLYTWGAGEQGQLGRKVLERRKIHGTNPEKITLGNRSRKAVRVGAGNYTSFAVDDKGDVWAWGLNNMGQTGTGSSANELQLPTKVAGLSRSELGGDETVTKIVGGEHHTLFLTSKGKVYSCGRSNGGQLGIPADDPVMQERSPEYQDMLAIPHVIEFPDEDDPVVDISTGVHNNMAITKDGALYTWGTGPQSELGAGEASELKTPKVIVRREGGSWAAVTGSCGGQHTLALLRKRE